MEWKNKQPKLSFATFILSVYYEPCFLAWRYSRRPIQENRESSTSTGNYQTIPGYENNSEMVKAQEPSSKLSLIPKTPSVTEGSILLPANRVYSSTQNGHSKKEN